jgi:hypothetical protein
VEDVDNYIATANGKPFETHKAARMNMGRRRLTDEQAEVVRMGTGYVIRLKGNPAEMSNETTANMEPEARIPEAPKKAKTRYFRCMFGMRTDGTTDDSDIALNPNGMGYLYFRRGEMVIAPEAYYEAAKDATCYELRTLDDGSMLRNRVYICPVSLHGEATEAEFNAMLAEGQLVSRTPFTSRHVVRNTMTDHLMAGM